MRKFPHEYYDVAVKIDSVEKAIEAIKKWSEYKKSKYKEKFIILEGYKYPKVFYFANNPMGNTVWAADDGQYSETNNYEPLSYSEFIREYFYTPSKYVRQLKFESFKQLINEENIKAKHPMYESEKPKEFKDYKIGDIVISTYNIDGRVKEGKIGKVVKVELSHIAVCFDDFTSGHDCEGKCKDDNGWNVFEEDNIKPYKPKPKSKYIRQLKFEEVDQKSLPLNVKWYKTEYDKETRFNRIICRKCNKSYVDDNKIYNRVKCPNCGFIGGLVQ